ncbi:neuronal tyrosine-phosphorylated phosphoinositide-3-kinase adapter 1 isoform X2 [Lepisosteus oculatus]|uniref:neuronal tyrosine-phosphorylated phosphoinositide-3-kinase adapter 1 isoform X2 n=1 Tax=Lepisosteus oculatus TaxID=7918 RepID=UPI003722E800
MSSGPTQDVVVENFLRDIERRGSRLHCAVIGPEGRHGDMNLLYRKSRLDWRHRDTDNNNAKKSSASKDGSVTVGKVRDMASFRRHFRMGFMTMPASQELSPRPCASAMAPRSQSCHSVGSSVENGEPQPPDPERHQHPTSSRCPPAKPKRHPSTRLSSTGDPRPPPPPPENPPPAPPPAKHSDKKQALKKSDSGELPGRKVPPLKPKRSPNTQLSVSFEDPSIRPPPLPRGPPPAAPPPPRPTPDCSPAGGGGQEEQEEEEEPVYIEMVGDVYREPQNPPPVSHPGATTPDSDSDQSEAIYEEMKYPLPEEAEPRNRALLNPEQLPVPSAKTPTPVLASSSSLPGPHFSSAASSSSSSSKPKATVSISHSAPLPSSSSVSASLPLPPGSRASTPFLFSKPSDKIPAPFPNLLQHRPPLLAFPQPAAASSGVGIHHKSLAAASCSSSAKLATVSTQPPSSLGQMGSCSSGASSSKLPKLQLGKEALAGGGGGGGAQQEAREKPPEGKEQPHLAPAPGLRARSHSTPLPPSSQSAAHYSHYHPHHHHHHHHHRKPDKELPTSHSMKLGPHAAAQGPSQLPVAGQKDRAFLRPDKREPPAPAPQSSPTPGSAPAPAAATSASCSAPAPPPGRSLTPASRTLHSRSQTPHPHPGPVLPLYQAQHASLPESCSPMLWTYPSAGLKRPPAYDSLRGASLPLPHPSALPRSSSAALPFPQGAPAGKAGGLARQAQAQTAAQADAAPGNPPAAGARDEEGPCWPLQRKMSFSHSSRDAEKPLDDARVWNGSTDALIHTEKEEKPLGQSGIPVRMVGLDGSSGRALGRSGLPLPCQTFPACHRNGELGRLGRSASTSGVRQGATNVQRQCSLPRDSLGQLQPLSQSSQCQTPSSGGATTPQQQPPPPQQTQAPQHLHTHPHFQYQNHPLHLPQCQPPATGGTPPTQPPRDGKLLEVIERKRCLCKEIKAHRRPERSLCKQDSMPILPSWRKTPEPRKTGTPPCQRQQAVLWDTAI